MGLTEQDYARMARDPKFMAARWKQRVAVSEQKLDKALSSNMSKEEKQQELYMHKKKVEKMREMQERAKR